MKCKNCGDNRFYDKTTYNLRFTKLDGVIKTTIASVPIRENIVLHHTCLGCGKDHFYDEWSEEERDES